MAKKDRLKNGLDMLFEDNYAGDAASTDSAQQPSASLRISLIEPDPDQPRSNFDEEKLRELADNISQHGILQPILVRPLENGSYRIVAGERRWRAARLAGLTEAPVVIRELSDIEAAQISLVENLQREDLDPIEEAAAYRRLMDEFHMTQESVAGAVGKPRSVIANQLRLLTLPHEVQQMLSAGEISVGHAKVLCGIEDWQRVSELAEIARNGCSVRELEKTASSVKKPEKPAPKPQRSVKNDEFTKFSITTQQQFKQAYGLATRVTKEKKGYSLHFDLETEEELKELIGRLSDSL